ncbi:MAG: radical SAM protein [Candidatus Omnitrophica bacterium]|nr:radical SAM protein [Candidatus Omnitrophota bacterium]
MRNNYFFLKIKLFSLACFKRKITLRKVWNVFLCSLFFLLKTKRSGPAPFILSLELGNECNANCLFCRDAKGVIHDINKINPLPGGITKGVMPYEMAANLVSQVKDDALIVVLYTNGEPLLYKDLSRLIAFCSANQMMSMIATNGLLLNEQNIREILGASIDFIKIQLSGFTQEIYNVQVRCGNVERLKQNIRLLVDTRKAMKSSTFIMIDFIQYNYNRHQLLLVREFCRDLGVALSVRCGNPQGGLEGREPSQSLEPLPLLMSCDWLWKGMQVNFNGEILPCCDGVIFSGSKPYHVVGAGSTDIRQIWNGEAAQKMRHLIVTQGRGAVPLCAVCYRKGVAFKW